ncbi:MAG: DUF4230 domain-containing protein [Saprospiraceae bacterium]|nr:DUF4230 domain-containing protein [Saprospiraceae bacterium]MDW8229510.1 DUF4230 domain-containing protein [Saprospiraceae bacterium]
MTLSRLWLYGLFLALAFLGGGWATYRFFVPKPTERPKGEASVLLEKVREVLKLTTVEGEFSEVYGYNEYSGAFSWLWDKKALLRVQATVAAGYDLSNVQMQADSAARVLRIGPLPKPQILSVDHTVDYYDVSTGLFQSFSPQDLTWINQQAKKNILEKAKESDLLQRAEVQMDKMFDLIRFVAEAAGWQVVVLRQPDGTPSVGR